MDLIPGWPPWAELAWYYACYWSTILGYEFYEKKRKR